MSQKGTAVVEFALVVPMVLVLVLGLVEVALVARTQLEVVNAAREGAREAAASPDPADAVRAARIALGGAGASARVFGGGAAAVPGRAVGTAARPTPLQWYRTTFARPKGSAPLALDLAGMTKGLAWLNGRCIGRYWLVAGELGAPDWQQGVMQAVNLGQPTQRFYHLPVGWLAETYELVLFEELGGDVSAIRVCRRQ